MIYIKAGNVGLEIGGNPITGALFYSIAHHLEKREWGSKYPIIMNELYYNGIEVEHLEQGLKEIKEIKEKLKGYAPEQIVWDYEDLDLTIPWINNISSNVTDLSNIFLSPYDRNNILDVIIEAIELGIYCHSKVYFELIDEKTMIIDTVNITD